MARKVFKVTTTYTVEALYDGGAVVTGKCVDSVCRSQIENTKKSHAEWLAASKEGRNPQIISVTVTE